MKIDLSTINGYQTMTPEQKIAALEGFEFDTSELDTLRETAKNQKGLIDKYTGEIGALKKKQNESLSEAEKKALAQEEAFAALQDKYDKLYKASVISDYTAKYIGLGYEKTLAEETAKALAEGNMEKVFANAEKFKVELEKKQKAEIAKSTPAPDAKGSSTVVKTKEDIYKIKDPIERQKAIAENLELFE